MRRLHISANLELLDGEGDAGLAFKVIMGLGSRVQGLVYLELLDGEGDAGLAFKVIMVQLTRIERGRRLQGPIATKIRQAHGEAAPVDCGARNLHGGLRHVALEVLKTVE